MDSQPTQNPETTAPKLTEEELVTGRVLDNGEPFQGKRPANARSKELGLSPDKWEVAEYASGYAIERKTDETNEDESPAVASPAAPEPEKYFWVSFHTKSNAQDPEEVILGCNGEVLQITRGKVIPIPQRFLEVADHSRFKHYNQEPGKDRKVDREIHKYPYEIKREATKADFVTWKRRGTIETRQAAQLSGIALEA